MEFDYKALPDDPTKEVISWAERRLLGNVHALIYRASWYRDPLTGVKDDCVEVFCSQCGNTRKMDKVRAGGCHLNYSAAPFGFRGFAGEAVISGESTLCPVCKRPAKALYFSSVRDEYKLASCLVLDIQRVQDRLALIYWTIQRRIDDRGIETTWTFPKVAYVVGRRRIDAYEFNRGSGWYARYQYKDLVGNEGTPYPWKKEILEGTTAENCKLDLYMKCKGNKYPVSYLRLWVQRPSVENLLVQGVGNILSEMIERDCRGNYGEVIIPKLSDVNWKDKRPAQMLGLTKELLRYAAKQNWKLHELEVFRTIAQRETLKPESDVPLLRQCGVPNVKHLLDKQTAGSIIQAARYLAKQKKCDAVTLVDYWRLVRLNGGDLQQRSVRWPQDLHHAHDNEASKQRFEKQKGYPRQFAQRIEALSPLSYSADGLLIRPVMSAEELYQEGQKLHHCVYSYLDRFVTAKTAIFLIRKEDDPETPFFTLELDEANMVVRQNRGLRNCARTPEVQAFEEKWLTWASTQKKERSKSA